MTGAVRVYAKGYVLDLTVPPKPISSRSESDRDPSLRCDSDSDGPPFCGVGCSAGGPTPGGPPAVSTARKSARLRASERACVHACVLARVRVARSFLPSLFRSPSPAPSHSHSPAPCAPPSLSLRVRETPHNPPPPPSLPFTSVFRLGQPRHPVLAPGTRRRVCAGARLAVAIPSAGHAATFCSTRSRARRSLPPPAQDPIRPCAQKGWRISRALRAAAGGRRKAR